MNRRTLRLLLGIALGAFVLAYGVLSSFAQLPLSPSEFWTFAAATLRATPAHLSGSDPRETLRLGGAAFGAPIESTILTAEGGPHTIPLPPPHGAGGILPSPGAAVRHVRHARRAAHLPAVHVATGRLELPGPVRQHARAGAGRPAPLRREFVLQRHAHRRAAHQPAGSPAACWMTGAGGRPPFGKGGQGTRSGRGGVLRAAPAALSRRGRGGAPAAAPG
jgi:hypothetical protein